ncbi:zinc finger protein 808-like [Galleria mellonella]|uniref:Zinc finger protein 808-like n=1 Tax=Galleria mellonella TaxID=7137 RepID=A0A6J3C1X6_GALME|nr:zinc finger protein 808-like [Galleria mellonella]
MKIHTDVNSQIIPFSFNSETLRCAVCTTEFSNFKILQEHMHVHFRNFICDVCNAGFVTKRLLVSHKRRHIAGIHKCSHCEKIFSCDQKRRDHEQRIHLGLKKKNKCKYCEEKFADYWTKVDHMVKEHGQPQIILKCQACERTFRNKRALTRHVKKDHLLERKHACNICDMKFFLKHRLVDHMIVHTGVKKVQCHVCNGWYASKKSLRQHLRSHANDRRFSCTVCGQAFVQNSQTPSTKESTVENMKLTLDKRVNFSTFITIKPSIQASKRAATMGRLTELDLHFDNIKTILRCSNATPVRCKVGDRYACGYCLAQFNKPNELKSHTLLMHTEDQPEVLKNRSLWKHIVYLDITSLFCKNCDDNLDNLKELMEHLKTKHDEVMHLHIKNQVVPCKFDGDDMKCGNCLMAFNTFDDLEDHMDEKHYRNYVCDFCDKGKSRKTIIVMDKKSSKLVRREIIEINPQPETKIVVKKLNEAHKHQENIKQILLYSNATPIRCHGGIGYRCCFCNDQYPEPADLKKHTKEKHDKGILSNFMKNRSIITYIVKLDITNLSCNICNESINNLESLIDHLQTKHDKSLNRNLKNHIVPFKFEKERLHCVVCSNEFNNFKVLLEHMNMHYRNYVCEVCGAGFINRRMLQTHGYRHKTGVFICSYCSKIFDTRVKQKEHERAVHICLNKRNKCGYCGEMFGDYTKKKDHEVKVHGARPVVLKCHACNKSFDNQRSLTVHTKAFHLMERRLAK